MKDVDTKTIAEILQRFDRPEPKESKYLKVDSLLKKIEELKSKKFTGAFCLSSKEMQKNSCRWIIFSEGNIKLVFLEEAKLAFSEDEFRELKEGAAYEVFAFDDFQITRLRDVLGEVPRVQPIRVLERGDMLKKYHLQEPTEEYADTILKGYRMPTPEERRQCEEMILAIRRDLSEMFGEKMADRMFDKQFASLGINKYDMTAKDIGILLNSLQHTVLEKLIGPERAETTIKKLKTHAFKIASQSPLHP